jgi:hypothetical protein
MTGSSRTLLDLQEADVSILRAHKRLKELPEKAELLALRTKIKEMTELKAKVALLVHKLEADLKARQDETAMITEKLAGEQTKVMATTDHRQITALSREMDGLRRRADKLDMESMQYMERIDKATAQVATVEGHLVSLAAKDAELVTRYQTVGAEVQAEIAVASKSRDKLAHDLPHDVLARYESIRDSKGGIGVGRLNGESCTACHMDLPAERVKALREGPDVGICPHCRRLIVVRAEGDE